MPPRLAKRASEASSASLLAIGGRGKSSDGGGRARQGSHTDRIEELQTLFNLFDTDGNGTIDEFEIVALFKKLGFEPRPEKMRELIARVDTDQNGSLEFAEFCEFLRLAKSAEAAGEGGLGISSAMESSLGNLADENGIISKQSLASYLQALAEATGQELSQADIDDVLALSDDGGGGSTVAGIREAMLLQPNERHTRAEAKRSMRTDTMASSAAGSDAMAAAI